MSHSGLDDTQLLQLLRNGSEEGFAEIYNRYWKLLYTRAFNIIQDEDFAKDAVQEVFIDCWNRRAITNILVLKPYLQQAVRYQVLKFIRAEKTDSLFYKRLATVTAQIVYENPLLFKEHEALLRVMLDSLPDDCRLIFQLSREEELTYKQIAGRLEISEKTVEKKMSICLKHFRQGLENDKILVVVLCTAFLLQEVVSK